MIHSRREIIVLLHNLEHRKQLVNLLVNGNSDAVVTSILEVDEVNGTVTIDCARSAHLNQRITESDNISFETTLDHIRILFFSSNVEACTYDNLPALRIALPESLVRLQRRDSFRVPVPMITPVRCSMQVPNHFDDSIELVTVTLQNVSGGGISLVDDQKKLDNTIGLVYKDCRINLPGDTVVVTSLEVRNTHDVSLANGKISRRIGCLFFELPKPMLAAIQRYITKLEREQNAKVTGVR